MDGERIERILDGICETGVWERYAWLIGVKWIGCGYTVDYAWRDVDLID